MSQMCGIYRRGPENLLSFLVVLLVATLNCVSNLINTSRPSMEAQLQGVLISSPRLTCELNPHMTYCGTMLLHHMTDTNGQLLMVDTADCSGLVFTYNMNVALSIDRIWWAYAIRRTDNPALIRPSHVKRKSMELGQSSATHSGLESRGLRATIGANSAATAFEPFLKSSKAGSSQ